MMLRFLTILTIFLVPIFVFGQERIIDLYEGIPPYSTGIIGEESWENGRVSNVQIPQLYIYKPEKENNRGVAVIYCPGGGYGRLAMPGYGKGYGDYFNEMGVTAIILKYRLPISENITEPHEVPLTDALQAIRLVRHMADDLDIDPGKVGIMGGSAGGHLASALSNNYNDGIENTDNEIDKLSSRPDFSILIYPVISMDTSITHMGSRRNLLGENPVSQLVKTNSSELNVTSDTPATFIIHGTDDASVSVLNSIRYYEALLKHNVAVEMHIFQNGRHGSGLGKKGQPWALWKDLCKVWMEQNIF
ncbi:alpha/beta hydrolase [Fulvivirga sp. M361]|uniref:alpha/beta hydrolase n=1 Tax=Fulvivirga sp. M361 TaxID=2594266 RepID=UPI00117A2BC8|nr:alpha/beta hydrolase [Fulvivirga sp. M361]TRX60197.1 alpha/beta hydrolase [Fulvivirga sp. M361]